MPEFFEINPREQLTQYYGVPDGSVLDLTGPVKPELLEYLDLMRSPGRKESLLEGVVENQGKPLLYFVSDSRLAESQRNQREQLRKLRRGLGCRGQRAYLAVIRPGQLDVVPVSLAKKTPKWQVYKPSSGEAATFFSRLALGDYDGKGEPRSPDFVFDRMFTLLENAADKLVDAGHGLSKPDVLSLIGRALFFRFLRDRRVIEDDHVGGIAPGTDGLRACFDSPKHAAATCQWLDDTFNGDFLPLGSGGTFAFFQELTPAAGEAISFHLKAILRDYEPAGKHYQQTLPGWYDFDFAHVPVGLLSQVYEAFCWKWDEDAGSTSVHYTPRNIAATLVGEAFEGLKNAHKARVLDPACGAGVLLVMAFRQLYRKRWEATGRRPGTKAIRKILEKQLAGFDISESAIRLSALSLYLTAIELDPNPTPPEALKFERLRDFVLFKFRREDDPPNGPVIGSLGDHVPPKYDGQFDIVVSNPPWTSLDKDKKGETRHGKLAEDYTAVSQRIIRARGDDALAAMYRNPDNAPDLPFFWRSTEWCKPGGRIAMALPARILLKQTDVPCQARKTLFQSIEVNGIVNGVNLADTKVWPKMGQPFMLVFARNERPEVGHVVRLVTPQYDIAANRRGEMRVDSKSVQPVDVQATFAEPWVWKAMGVGTALDIDVARKMLVAQGHPLLRYWKNSLGLLSRNGYKIEPDQRPQNDASFLRGLPNLTPASGFRFAVDARLLPKFSRATAFRPRKREVYNAPLVLVKQSPGRDRTQGWALLADEDVAFSQDFYGYSGFGHDDGKVLVRYVHVFVHSLVWMHFVLLTCPTIGAERRTIYKSVLDDCPIIPLEELSDRQRQEVLTLSSDLVQEKTDVFGRIDTFFAELYGLDKLDVEVIRDTLEVCLPYKESRERACTAPRPQERENFRRRLHKCLRPFFDVLGTELCIKEWKPEQVDLPDSTPFGVLLIGDKAQDLVEPDRELYGKVMALANETGASRFFHEEEGCLLVAVLCQYRYWTPSRARLCAAEILRSHMAVFGG
ncbi:N-6 DNA methylase [bacterium]|nr:N-6 DNA methylase [bacterium]